MRLRSLVGSVAAVTRTVAVPAAAEMVAQGVAVATPAVATPVAKVAVTPVAPAAMVAELRS